MEAGTRIVNLGDCGVTVTTFDDSLEQYSEARGRGRARRQKRRLDRIAKRKERKLAKQDLKTSKMQARQGRRTERQSIRQGRKMTRKAARLERKSLGEENEEPVESNEEELENDGAVDSSDSNYEPNEPSQPTEYESDEVAEEAPQESDDNFKGWEDEENFDGEKDIRIHPRIMDLSTKIEWNRELLSRLQKSNAANKTAKIADTQSRISELMHKLKVYVNVGGAEVSKDKKKQLVRAFKKARTKRNAGKPKSPKGGSEQSNATVVEGKLNPTISNQRIEVPAKSNFDGEDESNASGVDESGQRIRTIQLTPKQTVGVNIQAIAILAIAAGVSYWALTRKSN